MSMQKAKKQNWISIWIMLRNRDVINIAILLWLIYRQFKDGRQQWIESLQSVFSLAANAYMAWGLFLLIAAPLLFLIAG